MSINQSDCNVLVETMPLFHSLSFAPLRADTMMNRTRELVPRFCVTKTAAIFDVFHWLRGNLGVSLGDGRWWWWVVVIDRISYMEI